MQVRLVVFAKDHNEAFDYVYRRFDDMERRMGWLEERMDTMDRNITPSRTIRS